MKDRLAFHPLSFSFLLFSTICFSSSLAQGREDYPETLDDINLFATYFVDGYMGSDDGSGVFFDPFQTIQRAISAAICNGRFNTIVISSGDYEIDEGLVMDITSPQCNSPGADIKPVNILGSADPRDQWRKDDWNRTRIFSRASFALAIRGYDHSGIIRDVEFSSSSASSSSSSRAVTVVDSSGALLFQSVRFEAGDGGNGSSGYTPSSPGSAGNGGNGGVASPGSPGSGCVSGGLGEHRPGVKVNRSNGGPGSVSGNQAFGSIANTNDWRAGSGNQGGTGTCGSGGDGGVVGLCFMPPLLVPHGGGGGGGGGYGGSGGTGGGGAGGSIALLLSNSSGIMLLDNHFISANGGNGGPGAVGARGGAGGNGGAGALCWGQAAGAGGPGTGGQQGGHGGTGSGGAGGISVGILSANSSIDLLDGNYYEIGGPGLGGSGGNRGQDGIADDYMDL